ncbi:MAG: hypothetical protein AB1657_00810 [Candidatus Micrarchaeota archaeon]
MGKKVAKAAKQAIPMPSRRRAFSSIELFGRKKPSDEGAFRRGPSLTIAEKMEEARKLEMEAEHYESIFSRSQAAESYSAAAILFEEAKDSGKAAELYEKAAVLYEAIGAALEEPSAGSQIIDAHNDAASSFFAAASLLAEASPRKTAELLFRAAENYSKAGNQRGVRSSYSHAFAIAPAPSTPLSKKTVPRLIFRARKEGNSGNFSPAADLLFSAAVLSELTVPEKAPGLYTAAAENYRKCNRHGAAAASYSHAAALVSEKKPAKAAGMLLSAGEGLARSANYLGAAVAFSSALKLGTFNTALHYTPASSLAAAAESRLKAGSYFSAARAFFSAAYASSQLSPRLASGLFMRAGQYFLRTGKYEDAAIAFSSAFRFLSVQGREEAVHNAVSELLQEANARLESKNYLSAANALLSSAMMVMEYKPQMAAALFEKAGSLFSLSGRNCNAASSYSQAAVLLFREIPRRASEILEKAGESYGKASSHGDAASAHALAERLASGRGESLQRSLQVLIDAAERELKSGDALDAARLFSSAAELCRENDPEKSSELFEKAGNCYLDSRKYCSAASAYFFAAILANRFDPIRAMFLLDKASGCYGTPSR